jgi:hypothetical protein
MGIYETYTKRLKKREQAGQQDVYQYDSIPDSLRVQIIHIWDESIGPSVSKHIRLEGRARLWESIRDTLTREMGVFALTERQCDLAEEECKYFLLETNTGGTLDITELSFRCILNRQRFMDFRERPPIKADSVIEELNYRFREHGIGYQFVEGEIVRVDSQYIHAEAVKPALSLLNTAGFENASKEFLKAHEHYRKGRSSEAMSEALKAFESTMKYICDENGWSYSGSDAAKQLIANVLDNGLVPRYMEQHLAGVRQSLESGVPTVRNKNSGHGQGSQDRDIPDYLAAYSLHLAATNIVFLVESHQSKN